MGKAKPAHRDGLERCSLRRAFSTATACRETNQASRAYHMAMGTRRAVHFPGPARFRNLPGMTAVLSPFVGRLLCPSYSLSTRP